MSSRTCSLKLYFYKENQFSNISSLIHDRYNKGFTKSFFLAQNITKKCFDSKIKKGIEMGQILCWDDFFDSIIRYFDLT